MLSQWWDNCRLKRSFILVIICLSFLNSSYSQNAFQFIGGGPKREPRVFNEKRFKALVITEAGLYTLGMTGAYFLWYKNSFHSGFHSFNDSKEWLLMDKVGHFTTSFLLAEYSSKVYYWTNMDRKKANNIAALQSFFMMTSLEVMDGFSSGYGFSWTDMGFNLLGTGSFYLSKRFPERISIQPKYSFGESKYAVYRPSILGNNFMQQTLKDYNGQTYWLSLNLNKLVDKNVEWLNVWSAISLSFGYGANGMIGGHDNPNINEQGNSIPEFQRYRQYYFSLDLDLTKIRVSNPILRAVLNTLNIFKFPFPALEFSRGKVFMNWTSYGR